MRAGWCKSPLLFLVFAARALCAEFVLYLNKQTIPWHSRRRMREVPSSGAVLRQATFEELMAVFHAMLGHFGPKRWWPADTREEVIIGALLTQSVAWKNVTMALNALRSAGLLGFSAIHEGDTELIEKLIIPTRYYKQKAKKLKAFAGHLVEKYDGDLGKMFDKDIAALRKELLGIYGIGEETADSIILYAAEKPIFVVDAYTRRIFSRLGYFSPDITYREMQEFFHEHLPPDVALYNEYHAQIDGLGHHFCAASGPACRQCPLAAMCGFCTSDRVQSSQCG